MRNELEKDERGNKYWYKNGILHRENGPAVEYADGTKFWYQNGELYRENDLPHCETANGDKMWWCKWDWYTSFEEYMLVKVMG